MRDLKFRLYFEADEDEPSWMSEPITLSDLLHGEDIEFRDEEDTVSLSLNDFRFFYRKNEKYKIMQYTGLHDKNGKEIYEGDIVKANFFNKEITGKIEFAFGAFFVTGSAVSDNQMFIFSDYEVIGNIYENPELLEKGEIKC